MRLKTISLILSILIGTFSVTTIAEIIINDERNFVLDKNTLVFLDDELISAEDFEKGAIGMIALVLVGDDANENVTAGTVNEIHAINQIKGPVTSVNPFQVLGQDVIPTSTTVLENTNGVFAADELLEVSGYFNNNAVLLATRIETNNILNEWKLLAHVTAVNNDIISFGQLHVNINSVATSNCNTGPAVGDLVELKATPIVNFDISLPLGSATQFECKTDLIGELVNPAKIIIGFELEGFVTAIVDTFHFKLNNQLISISNSVEFVNGTAEDLTVGVKVEVEGTLDTQTSEYQANKIKFRESRVRIEAPVSIGGISNEQIMIMNNIGIISALTEDKDGILPAGLLEDRQIELRGFVDGANTIFVDEFRDRGTPDFMDTRLRGIVESISSNDFVILGVTIDSTGATFFDINDQVISMAEFFDQLLIGAQVDVNNAAYDEQLNRLLGGEISLENTETIMSTSSTKSQVIMAGGVGGLGLGTISKFKPPIIIVMPPPPPPAEESDGGGSINLFFLLILTLFTSRKCHRRNVLGDLV